MNFCKQLAPWKKIPVVLLPETIVIVTEIIFPKYFLELITEIIQTIIVQFKNPLILLILIIVISIIIIFKIRLLYYQIWVVLQKDSLQVQKWWNFLDSNKIWNKN